MVNLYSLIFMSRQNSNSIYEHELSIIRQTVIILAALYIISGHPSKPIFYFSFLVSSGGVIF
jgi:hypothetical protein